jgi:hypothetical protein
VQDHKSRQGRHRLPRGWRSTRSSLRRSAPTGCAILTARILVGDPRRVGHLGVIGNVLGFARTVAVGALLIVIIMCAMSGFGRYREAHAGWTANAHPRWQYLLLSAGFACAAIPSLTYACEFGSRNSLAVNFWAVVGIWTGLATLIALGRALLKGRAGASPGGIPAPASTKGLD